MKSGIFGSALLIAALVTISVGLAGCSASGSVKPSSPTERSQSTEQPSGTPTTPVPIESPNSEANATASSGYTPDANCAGWVASLNEQLAASGKQKVVESTPDDLSFAIPDQSRIMCAYWYYSTDSAPKELAFEFIVNNQNGAGQGILERSTGLKQVTCASSQPLSCYEDASGGTYISVNPIPDIADHGAYYTGQFIAVDSQKLG